MSIPYYRVVGCTDDGHFDTLQCLHCKGHMVLACASPAFCPLCGHAWIGRLRCRLQGIPAWAWNRYADSQGILPWKLQLHPAPIPRTHAWVIESRVRWIRHKDFPERPDATPWRREVYCPSHTAREAWKQCKSLRECTDVQLDEYFEIEYRIRRIQEGEDS